MPTYTTDTLTAYSKENDLKGSSEKHYIYKC